MSVKDILIDGKILSQYYDVSTFPNVDIDQVVGLEAALTVITDDISDINNSVGQPDGICPLNASGKIDNAYLDPSVFTFEGVWDALINIPTLVNGTGNIGDMYIVSVGGVRFGETFVSGDYCVYVNGLWEKIASGSNSVTSVSAGSNVSIGGTAQAPIVNVIASPAFTQVSSSAPVPIASGDLTRKDYVDLHLLKSANLSDVQSLATTKTNLQVEKIPNVKQTLNAIVPPTINDDNTLGYDVASRIIDIVASKEFLCLDNSSGAAVWKETTAQASGEVNTASNLGVSTYGLFKTKVLEDLQFKSLTASSNKITLTSNTNDVGIDVNQANLTLTKSQVGLSNVENILNNYTSVVDPTVNDDSSLFYSVGSRWYNNTTDTIFECFSAVNPAVWIANTTEGQNVGFAPNDVFKDKVGKSLRFRRLASATGLLITQLADTIDLTATPASIGLGNVANASLVQTNNQVLITAGPGTLTFSTPQNIHTTATTNFQSTTLSQASGNAVNLTGTNSVIKLTGANSSIENTGIIGSVDRTNISHCRYFYWNNVSNAAMNIFNDYANKLINVSNLAGGNDQNIFVHYPLNRQLFPFSAHVNFRADMTQGRIACFWQINGVQPVSNFRFGIMGEAIFENYAQETGGTTNARGIFNNNNRNTITFEFTNGGALRHQNDDVTFSTFAGTHYGANFDNGDIIIMVSSFDNPPTIRLHAYNFAGGVATWKNSYSFVLRSGSMMGGDAHTRGYAFINMRVNGANANLLSQRWLQNNVTSYVNGGTYDPTQTVSYYY